MKILQIAIVFLGVSGSVAAQNVGIVTNTPDASAKLDVESTSSGLLVPRMSTAQRTAIGAPAPDC